MKRSHVKEVKAGKEILIEGFVLDIRDLGSIKFLVVRDVSGIIQVTALKKKTSPELYNKMSEISKESVVVVKGKAVKSKQAPGGVEIVPSSIKVIVEAQKPLPIDISKMSKTGLSKRLDWRSLDLRNPRNLAIFEIQARLVEGMQDYLNKEGYLQVFTPCIMGVPSESGSDVFTIMYYKTSAFLRQDPQLHRQLTIAGGVEKLYDLGPSWRAEVSHTTRHLSEHRGCAVELAFIKDEADTMRVEENVVVAGIKNVIKNCKEQLELLNVKLKVPKTPFPELRFPKIYDILAKMGKKLPENADLDSKAEDLLWQYVKKKYKSDFYFFYRFPFAIKPFYVMRVDEEPEYARSVDLNGKGIELSSGGQRENRYEQLMQNVKEKKINPKSVEWFTKFFKFGVPPHGGFNIGIERLTQVILNLKNIKECVLFARDPERLVP